jgi:hypothetical protein
MMIDPPVMSWPPKAFTPSRCAFESRPFVELPPPFLCAIAESPFQKQLPASSHQLLAHFPPKAPNFPELRKASS